MASKLCHTALRIDHGRRKLMVEFDLPDTVSLIGDRNQLALVLMTLWTMKSLVKSGIDPEAFVTDMKEFWHV